MVPKALLLASALVLLAACTREATGSPAPAPSRAPGSTPSVQPITPAPAPPSGPICIETVVIQGRKVTPETLTIRRNCVVLFTNRDETVEQIQGHDFLLGEMEKDQSWAHTYRDPGAFEFFSVKNPTLRGRVIVQP